MIDKPTIILELMQDPRFKKMMMNAERVKLEIIKKVLRENKHD